MKKETITEKWEKKFDKLCIEYMADDFVDVDWWKDEIKSFIKTLISDTAKNAREEVRENLLKLPNCNHIEKMKACILCFDNRNLK